MRLNTDIKVASASASPGCVESVVDISPGAENICPGEFVLIPCGAGVGAGAGESVPDISPPRAEIESTPVKAIVIKIRFIVLSSCESCYARFLTLSGN